jgi:uncharacterized protein YndB with AHSA1/START domain
VGLVPAYDVTATCSASPERIWSLLLDARTWPLWSPVDELVLDRSSGLGADHAATTVGSVRAFRTGEVVTGERVTELVEHRRLSYEDAFNAAMHDYRATVELTPVAAGTAIRWHGTYATAPELAEVLPPHLQDFMQQMADGLAAHAARLRPA